MGSVNFQHLAPIKRLKSSGHEDAVPAKQCRADVQKSLEKVEISATARFTPPNLKWLLQDLSDSKFDALILVLTQKGGALRHQLANKKCFNPNKNNKNKIADTPWNVWKRVKGYL